MQTTGTLLDDATPEIFAAGWATQNIGTPDLGQAAEMESEPTKEGCL